MAGLLRNSFVHVHAILRVLDVTQSLETFDDVLLHLELYEGSLKFNLLSILLNLLKLLLRRKEYFLLALMWVPLCILVEPDRIER